MAKQKVNTMVYDTRSGKEYPIHPDFINDKAWLQQRGLVPIASMGGQTITAKPVGAQTVADLEAKLRAEIEAKLRLEIDAEKQKTQEVSQAKTEPTTVVPDALEPEKTNPKSNIKSKS